MSILTRKEFKAMEREFSMSIGMDKGIWAMLNYTAYYYRDKTYKVLVTRKYIGSLEHDKRDIVLNGDKLYVPPDMCRFFETSEFLSGLLNNFDNRILLEEMWNIGSVGLCFCNQERYKKIFSENRSLGMSPLQFLMMNKYTYEESSRTLHSYYFPNLYEIEFIKILLQEGMKVRTPIIEVTTENIHLFESIWQRYVQHLCRSADAIMQEAMPVESFRRAAAVPEDDAVSRITMFAAESGELNEVRWKEFERLRHSVLCGVIMASLGLDITASDVNIPRETGYTGRGSELTPDIIYRRGGDIYLVECLVTEVDNIGRLIDNKKVKYRNLRAGLERHINDVERAERQNWSAMTKSVYTCVICLKISNSTPVINMDPYMREIIRENLEEKAVIRCLAEESCRIAEMARRYSRLAREEEEQYSSKDSLIVEIKKNNEVDIMNRLVDELLSKKKGIDMMAMRNSKLISEMDSVDHVLHEEQFFIREIRKIYGNYKAPDYRVLNHNLYQDFCEYMRTNNEPYWVKSFLQHDHSAVKEKMLSMRKEQFNKLRMLRSDKMAMGSIGNLFKFPMIKFYEDPSYESLPVVPTCWTEAAYLDDGTALLMNNPVEEALDDKPAYDGDTEGIGLDEVLDVNWFEEVISYMSEEVGRPMDELNDYLFDLEGHFQNEITFNKFMKTRMWSVICFFSHLCKNIAYLEGRRKILDDSDVNSKGHTIVKRFSHYWLMIRKGSKMTSQKQIRFRIYCERGQVEEDSMFTFHSMKEDESGQNMKSKWLSVSTADMEHFIKLPRFVLTALSHSIDLEKEKKKVRYLNITTTERNDAGQERVVETTSFKMSSFIKKCVVWTEHKRGTSTTLQLNRYILHSQTALFSNREGLYEKILEEPIRSRLEAYIRIRQCNWSFELLSALEAIWSQRGASYSRDTSDYDRINLPSFFEGEVELKETIEELYIGYGFNKSSGFSHHRQAKAVEKMYKKEKQYKEIKDDMSTCGFDKSFLDLMKDNSSNHSFHHKALQLSIKKFMSNPSNVKQVQTAFSKAMTDTVKEAMGMTSSLVACPYRSSFVQYAERNVTEKAFVALFDVFRNSDTNSLVGILEKMDDCEAIFKMFDKAQIGGPREILIQCVQLRVYVMLLERFFSNLSEEHPKNMLGKDKLKVEIQSKTLSRHREEMKEARLKGKKAIMFSLNLDCTSWANYFMMEQFCQILEGLSLPPNFLSCLISCVSSFSKKVVTCPDSLMKKWKVKEDWFEIKNRVVKEYRDEVYNNGWWVIIESGMGQGMFHRMSNFQHLISQDLLEEHLERLMRERWALKMNCSTLITSDDKTMIVLLTDLEANRGSSDCMNPIKEFYTMVEAYGRLHNQWINEKKSAVQLIITEFNSCYSYGKRMLMPLTKDLYSTHNTPDYTYPKMAVLEFLSNCSRLVQGGAYYDTLKTAMLLGRQMVMEAYRYDQDTIDALMEKLELDNERQIPYQLGFVPVDDIMTVLVFGPDFTMFKSESGDVLKSFYRNLYTAVDESESSVDWVDLSNLAKGEYKIKLPTRLDKAMRKLRTSFYRDRIGEEMSAVLKSVDKTSLDKKTDERDRLVFMNFCKAYFLNPRDRYAFNESMPVQSLVRALSMPKGKCHVVPMTKSRSEKLMEYYSSSGKGKDLRNALWREFLEGSIDVLGFVDFVLARSGRRSCIEMVAGYKKVAELAERVKDSFSRDLNEVRGLRPVILHESYRPMRFYMPEVGLNISLEEFINMCFNPEPEVSTRIACNFMEMLSIMSVELDFNELLENPFKVIKKLFPNSDMPFRSLHDLFETYTRIGRFHNIQMLSGYADRGNAEDNMMLLHRVRRRPGFCILEEGASEISRMNLLFRTQMTTGIEQPEWMDEDREILISDSRMSVARKLYRHSEGELVQMNEMGTKRMMFFKNYLQSSKGDILYWTDFRVLCVLMDRKGERLITTYCYKLDPELRFEALERSSLNCIQTMMRERDYLASSDLSYSVTHETINNPAPRLVSYDEAFEARYKCYKKDCGSSWKIMIDLLIGDSLGLDQTKKTSTTLVRDNKSLSMSAMESLMCENRTLGEIRAAMPPLSLDELQLEFDKFRWLHEDCRQVVKRDIKNVSKSEWKKMTEMAREAQKDVRAMYSGMSMNFLVESYKMAGNFMEDLDDSDDRLMDFDDEPDSRDVNSSVKTANCNLIEVAKLWMQASDRRRSDEREMDIIEDMEERVMGVSLTEVVVQEMLRSFNHWYYLDKVKFKQLLHQHKAPVQKARLFRTQLFRILYWFMNQKEGLRLRSAFLVHLTHVLCHNLMQQFSMRTFDDICKYEGEDIRELDFSGKVQCHLILKHYVEEDEEMEDF